MTLLQKTSPVIMLVLGLKLKIGIKLQLSNHLQIFFHSINCIISPRRRNLEKRSKFIHFAPPIKTETYPIMVKFFFILGTDMVQLLGWL